MKDFITSPLEQFYVLSMYDFSIVDISSPNAILGTLLLFISSWIDLLVVDIFQSTISEDMILRQSIEGSTSLPLYLGGFLSLVFILYRFISNLFLLVISFLNVGFLSSENLMVNSETSGVSMNTGLSEFYLTNFYSVGDTWQTNMESLPVKLESNSSWMLETSFPSTLGESNSLLILDFFYQNSLFLYNNTVGYLVNLCTKDFAYLIISLNTSSIWLTLSFLSLSFLMFTSILSLNLVASNRWHTLFTLFYSVILNLVKDNVGEKGLKYFPLIFTTFMLILGCNVLGMIPYSFTVTSHLIITFTTALAIFVGMNIIGILKHKKHFLSLFFPPGAPVALAPLLVIIEFVSYIFRVVSLSVRLFANLMSGHTLLKILASFSWGVVSFWGIFVIPITIIFIVTGLEMAIAFLQAYIFAVLLCIYLHDAFNLH